MRQEESKRKNSFEMSGQRSPRQKFNLPDLNNLESPADNQEREKELQQQIKKLKEQSVLQYIYLPPLNDLDIQFNQEQLFYSITSDDFLSRYPNTVNKSDILQLKAQKYDTLIDQIIQQEEVKVNINELMMDSTLIKTKWGLQQTQMSPIEWNRDIQKKYIFQNKGNEEFYNKKAILIQESDILFETFQKLAQTLFFENQALITKTRNAVRSERINQIKNTLYKMEVTIGQISIQNHPFFNQEEKQASLLKQKVAQYKEMADMALIPHYSSQIQQIEQELQRLQTMLNRPDQEIDLLERQKNITYDLQNEEIKKIGSIIEEIHAIWDTIQKNRDTQGFTSTPVKLQVKQYKYKKENAIEQHEIELFLSQAEITYNDDISYQQVPSIENQRRQKLKNLQFKVKILVNGNEVATTQSAYLQWPEMEVRFAEKFELFLFSKPESLQFQVISGNIFQNEIATINASIPGENVNTIRSAAPLYDESSYLIVFQSQKQMNLDLSNGSLQIQQQGKSYEFRNIMHQGLINYRAEWQGNHHRMPPKNNDLIQKNNQNNKEIKININKLQGFNIDVCDPRNQHIIEKIKKQQDSKDKVSNINPDLAVPYSNVQSLRQILIEYLQENEDIFEQINYEIPFDDLKIKENPQLLKLIYEIFVEKQAIIQNQIMVENQSVMIKSKIENVDTYPQNELVKQRIQQVKKLLGKLEKKTVEKQQSSAFNSLGNFVNEFQFSEDMNPIEMFIRELFVQKRKLAKVQVTQEKVDRSTLTQFDIIINMIKGNNVPIRKQAYKKMENIKSQRDFSQKNTFQNRFDSRDVRTPMSRNRNDFNSSRMSDKTIVDEEVEELERVQSYLQVRLELENREPVFQQGFPVEGQNPIWNQSRVITVSAGKNKKFNNTELQNDSNRLMITLFDEIKSENQFSQNQYNTIVERQYMGQCEVPLACLLQQNNIDAQFLIRRPFILFGYFTQDQSVFQQQQNEKEILQDVVDPTLPTYLHLNIAINPPLHQIDNIISYQQGKDENQKLLQKLSILLYDLMNNYPKLQGRNIKVWDINTEGNSIILTRFIKPQQPPINISDDDPNILEKCARFVSLIPFKFKYDDLHNSQNCLLNNQETLDLRAGGKYLKILDYLEHAILLCNYFIYIEQQQQQKQTKSYVILGKSYYGRCAYVLRQYQKDNKFELWDPKHGEPYFFDIKEFPTTFLCFQFSQNFKQQVSQQNFQCPLTSIDVIFDQHKIWINLQDAENPSKISLNLRNPNEWQELIEKAQQILAEEFNLESIQPTIQYENVYPDYTANLEYKLEQFLREKIMDQRNSIENGKRPYKTKFENNPFQSIKTQLLPSIESFTYQMRCTGFNNDEEQRNEFIQKALKQIREIKDDILDYQSSRFKFYGFPYNTTFISMEQVWKEINDTEFFNIASNNVDFVLQVVCQSYPNYIISTWIFVAAIIEE